jgi:hypothetical protein
VREIPKFSFSYISFGRDPESGLHGRAICSALFLRFPSFVSWEGIFLVLEGRISGPVSLELLSFGLGSVFCYFLLSLFDDTHIRLLKLFALLVGGKGIRGVYVL